MGCAHCIPVMCLHHHPRAPPVGAIPSNCRQERPTFFCEPTPYTRPKKMWCYLIAMSAIGWSLTSPPSRGDGKAMWTNFDTQPTDPTLSCYLLRNQTWNCVPDVLLRRDMDSDDSY